MLQLDNETEYTVFAPSNLAFDQLQPSVSDKLLRQDGCGPGHYTDLVNFAHLSFVRIFQIVGWQLVKSGGLQSVVSDACSRD